MTPLPIIESCRGCGACCREQESPPGYVGIISDPANFIDENNPASLADAARLESMPAEILQELQQYRTVLLYGIEPETRACIWLDESTGCCKHYDLRPSFCREFEMVGDECREWRKKYGVDA